MTTSRIFRLFSLAGVRLALAGSLAVALGSSGCAGASGSLRSGTLDVRGSAEITDREPRMLIEGPTRLLHVDVDRKQDVALFRVARWPGSPVDCRQDAVAVEAAGFARSGTSVLDLDVAADEAICFAVGPAQRGSRNVSVSWHARGQKTTNLAANSLVARQP